MDWTDVYPGCFQKILFAWINFRGYAQNLRKPWNFLPSKVSDKVYKITRNSHGIPGVQGIKSAKRMLSEVLNIRSFCLYSAQFFNLSWINNMDFYVCRIQVKITFYLLFKPNIDNGASGMFSRSYSILKVDAKQIGFMLSFMRLLGFITCGIWNLQFG